MSIENYINKVLDLLSSVSSESEETLASKVPAFMPLSKEEHLAFIATWRAHYANLSEEIRDLKKQRRQGSDAARSSAQSTHHYKRLEATNMMAIRTAYDALRRERKQDAA